MTAKPLRTVVFAWDDDNMVPEPRFLALCRRQFVVGEKYPMEVVQPRNMDAHRGYFAQLHEAWQNLSHEDTARFKTSEHFRGWLLVETGFCTETDYPCDSHEEALKWARNIRTRSPYSVIKIFGDVIKVFDPESQAVYGPNAMPAERFMASKKAVLDLAASMARTTPAELKKNAGQSA